MFYKLLAVFLCCGSLNSAFAITIDPFNTNQTTNSSLSINTISPAEALGGTRKILAKKTSGSLGQVKADSFYDSDPAVNNGAYFQSHDAGISGESTITWDGTASAAFNAYGLGGINFLEDNSNSFILSILDYDAPASGDVKIILTVHNGPISASVTQTIKGPGELNIPFSSFKISPDAAFDFTKVGALTLKILGGPSADLSIDFLKTNGKCEILPTSSSQVIVDLCGACGGDNSSCKDCLGVPNGSAKPDQCGVCAGDGQSCLNCEVDNSSDLSTDLDQAAKKQEHRIKIVVNSLDRQFSKKVKGLRKNLEQLKAEAHRLQVRNWTISWFLPPKIIICENQSLCVRNSVNVPIIDEYRVHAKALYELNLKAITLYSKYTKQRLMSAKYKSDAFGVYKTAIALSNKIPRGQDICS